MVFHIIPKAWFFSWLVWILCNLLSFFNDVCEQFYTGRKLPVFLWIMLFSIYHFWASFANVCPNSPCCSGHVFQQFNCDVSLPASLPFFMLSSVDSSPLWEILRRLLCYGVFFSNFSGTLYRCLRIRWQNVLFNFYLWP